MKSTVRPGPNNHGESDIAVKTDATWTRWIPALVPIGVACAYALVFKSERALIPAVVGLGIGALIAAGMPVQRWISNSVERIVQAFASVLGVAIFLVLIFPAWLWTTVRRRSPLASHSKPGTNWVAVASSNDRSTARHLGSDLPVGPNKASLVSRLATAVGTATLLLGANYCVGWTWDSATAQDPDPVAPVAPNKAPVFLGETTRDPRNDVRAMSAYPWRAQYFTDIQKTVGGYWPFTEYRPYPFSSQYLNLDGWIRRSYPTADSPDDEPVVWMLGGSTTWGEGQRDDYTIASWLARIAEDEGVSIQISNYGQRGWVHFQEMVLFEQQISEQGAPDLALFYDGGNEVPAQSLVNEPVPTHVNAYQYSEKLFGTRVVTQAASPAGTSIWTEVVDVYREHSALHKVASQLRTEVASASEMQENGDDVESTYDEFDDGFTRGQEVGPNGSVYNYKMTEQDGIDAGRVYERGKQSTRDIAERAGVDPLFFWQPRANPGLPETRAIEQLTDTTIDISNSLDGHYHDVYIDSIHTNEEGAQIVAEAIWDHLGPKVHAWYKENE